MSLLIEVAHRLKAGDSANRKQIQEWMASAGLKKVVCNQVASLYRLEGPFSSEEAHTIAQELFCDPVAEKYFLDRRPSDKKTFFADVWVRDGVTEPVGESSLKAISDLKIATVKKVCSGTRFEFHLKNLSDAKSAEIQERQLARFVTKHLLNPLIQECEIVRS